MRPGNFEQDRQSNTKPTPPRLKQAKARLVAAWCVWKEDFKVFGATDKSLGATQMTRSKAWCTVKSRVDGSVRRLVHD